FSPSLVCGVWVGTDRKETLGKGETGAQAALPIWIDFMGHALEKTPSEEFVRPSGVELVAVDRRTGRRAAEDTGCDPGDVILEASVSGSEPATYCSASEHARLRLPYYLQRFDLNDDGELVGRPEEIASVLQAGGDAHLVQGGRAIEAWSETGQMTVPLALDAGE